MADKLIATISSLAVVAGLAASGSAVASTAYKWRARNGVIGYSQVVPTGAEEIGRMEMSLPQTGSSKAWRRLELEQSTTDTYIVQLESRWNRVETDLREARDALSRAKANRDAGQEPRPGERLGRVGGGSRLAFAYFQRQNALAHDVEEAQQRLNRALQARNDLRG